MSTPLVPIINLIAVRAPSFLALGLLLAAGTAHAAPLFKTPFLMFEPGATPTSVAIADLNEDGRPDLAVTHGGDPPPAVAILLGNGDGTFGPPTDFEVGWLSLAIRAADLNGDGHLDLAVANHGHVPDYPSTITVLLGHGDGTFDPRADFEVEMGTRDLAIADLDADGALDLVTENSVLLGNGDGSFGARIGFGQRFDQSVAVGDLDGDGRLDVVTGNGEVKDEEEDGFTAIAVRLGRGDGTFAAPAKFGTGFRLSGVAIADLNADGRPDVAAANQGSSPDENGYVSVFLGNGDGTLQTQRRFDTDNNPSSIAIADLDADGRLDIATCNSGDDPDFDSNTITVLLGNGDGTYRGRSDLNVGENPSSLAIGDLDGNGWLDLVTADFHSVSVVLGRGDGIFGIPEFGVGGHPQSLAASDLNGDGSQDLAVANTTSTTVSILLGNGDGTFAPRTDFETGGHPWSVAISDLNTDGHADLAIANWDYNYALPGTLSVLLGNGDGTFQPKVDYAAGTTPGSVAIADLNGDAHPDVAVANIPASSLTYTMSVWFGNGDGTLGPRNAIPADGYGPWSLAISDFDEDGRLDIATINYGSPGFVTVLLGNGDGTFRHALSVGTGSYAANHRPIAAADLDSDGHVDIVAGDLVLMGNGDGTFDSPIHFHFPNGEFMAIADFDADGKLDVVAATPDFNYLTGEVEFRRGNGDGTFAPRVRFGTARFPHSPIAADFNGDGRPDLAIANFRAGSVSVLLNQTGDRPTPTLLSLASSHVERDRVELTWFAPAGDVSMATVYRRTVRDNWKPIGEIRSDGTGQLVYRERTVIAGTRYGYRLGVMEARQQLFLGETWVDVPVAAELALAGFRSNPARDDRSVAFTLVDASPARLEMFDVGGRKIATREVGTLGAGSHVVTLGDGRMLTPGVYLLRLSQGIRSIMARAVIIR